MKLCIGGSPCTHWSIARTKNRETEPSGIGWNLFENYLIALEKFRPDFFLYENNKSMSASIRAEITKRLGVEPICINSALVSAQNRQRLYWVGKREPDGTYSQVPVEQPEDRGILLRDILETGVTWREKAYTLKANYHNASAVNAVDGGHFPAPMAAEPVNTTADGKAQCLRATYYKDGIRNMVGNMVDRKTCVAEPMRVHEATTQGYTDIQPGECVNLTVPKSKTRRGRAMREKSNCLTTSCEYYEYCGTLGRPIYEVRDGRITIKGQQYPIKLMDGYYIVRKLTVRECMRLQTVPEDYVFPVSDTRAYRMLGNGWTVDVIAHILSHCQGLATEPLDVLSMYDGMACGHIALDKLGAKIIRYRATEIDKYAIKTACYNFPDIEQLGDAYQVREWNALPYPKKEVE